MEDPAAVAPPPESWETADLDGAMSRLLLSTSTTSASARRVASSPDLADDDEAAAQEERRDPAGADDLVAQVDQFLREAIEKPRERLSGKFRPHASHGSSCYPSLLLDSFWRGSLHSFAVQLYLCWRYSSLEEHA